MSNPQIDREQIEAQKRAMAIWQQKMILMIRKAAETSPLDALKKMRTMMDTVIRAAEGDKEAMAELEQQ